MNKELDMIEPVKFDNSECPYCHTDEPGACADEYIIDVGEKYTPDKKYRELGIDMKCFGQYDPDTKCIIVNVLINDQQFAKSKYVKINYCPMCGRKL